MAKSRLTPGATGGVTYTATATVAGPPPVQWTAQAMTPGTLSQSFSLPFESPLPAPAQVLAPEFPGVFARSSQGAGMAGVPITYTVIAGGGSVSPAQTVTGAGGYASATLTLGPQAGTNTVRVSAPGFQPISISFSTLARIPFGSVRVVPDTVRLCLPYYVTGAGPDLSVHADSTFVIVQ